MDIPGGYKDIESFDVRHAPIISAFCDKINLSSIIDKALDTKMDVSPGKIVKGLVLNTLAGRDPLYRVEDFFSHQDTGLVVGKGIGASDFTDDNIGRVLDRIYSYGTQKLFCELSLEAVKKFNIDTTQIHHDTTSVSVWGDYLNKDGPFEINHGHSKDKRPDLAQFVLSLLCVEKDIPIETRIYSGNEDDKTISRAILSRISSYMAKYEIDSEGYIYTGDCSMVTGDNLAFMGGLDNPEVKFISRMPATFGVVGTLVSEAVSKNMWTDIGILSEEKKGESAYYRSYEKEVSIEGRTYRAVVIHSDFYDRRRKKKIDKETRKDLEKAKKIKKKLTSTKYFCKKDAEVAAEKEKLPKYHRLKTDIEEKKIYKKGRPKNGKKEVAAVRYILRCDIIPDDKLIEDLKEEAGCFVLISNVAASQHSARDILKIYKEQHGIEKNFGFLKDPLIVNDLFLKKTERIEALGFILVISLLIWRLAERCMRKYIKEKAITITGWDKKQTDRPTTFMMSTKFCSVHILKKGGMRWLPRKISSVQKEYLDALGLGEEIFYTAVD
nr:IS1634 family transposase [Candidatus Omnitrophota bacterium]